MKLEPVAYIYKESSPETGEFVFAEQAEQDPVAQVVKSCKTFNVYEAIVDTGNKLLAADTKLYAAPVRTKDLTDDEKADLLEAVDWYNFPEDLINAAIAADREKNK